MTVDASRRPCSAIAARTASPCAASSSAVSSRSTHFGLPTCERSSSSASQILRISACASSSASRIVSSGTWIAPRLDHRQRLARPDHDEIERRLAELLERRVDDELALEPSDPDRADRAEERERRDLERGRGAVDAEDVVVSRGRPSVVHTRCTSLRKPLGQSGLIGRSIMRAVRVARSVARPRA